MRLWGQLVLVAALLASIHTVVGQSESSSTANASAAATNLNISPDVNADALLSSPMSGLMPELTPSEETEGILLFLLQVSGPAAYIGNQNLNWALSVNLATRLDYITVDNLYLLNYTQLPTNSASQGRKLLQTSTPTPTPAIGEISSGVVDLPDLNQEAANLTSAGTGVVTSSPSIAFMYEADVGSADYVAFVHNQLNSIIATSALLTDVRHANLSVNSIYLVSFEPAYEPNATSITSYAASDGKSSHRRMSIILMSTLLPVALLAGALAGSFLVWNKSRRKARRRGFTTQESGLDGADSMQNSKIGHGLMNQHLGSKELSGLTSATGSASFTALSIEGMPQASSPPKDGVVMPPAWIDDIPFSDWEVDADDVAICVRPDGRRWEVGAGAFSKVYRGLLRSVQVVAIKVFNDGPQYGVDSDEQRLQTLSALRKQREVLIRQEIAVLKHCRDRNIVQFVGACIRREQTMLITEYMEGGDLYHAIASDSTGRFSWYRTLPDGTRTPALGRRIALDVARGLHFLHSRRLVHFDLKSANILLARDHTAKIADVGLAKIMHRQFLSTLYNVGTFAWSAPEVLLGKSTCTEMVDIYSYGVVLWEICAGEAPSGRQLRPLRVPEDCPQAAADLVLRCTDENPDVRPSAREIVDCLAQLKEPSQ